MYLLRAPHEKDKIISAERYSSHYAVHCKILLLL